MSFLNEKNTKTRSTINPAGDPDNASILKRGGEEATIQRAHICVFTVQILQVKEKIEKELSLGAAAQQKLIHSGKILKNDQTVSGAKIKANEFLVIMVSKV